MFSAPPPSISRRNKGNSNIINENPTSRGNCYSHTVKAKQNEKEGSMSTTGSCTSRMTASNRNNAHSMPAPAIFGSYFDQKKFRWGTADNLVQRESQNGRRLSQRFSLARRLSQSFGASTNSNANSSLSNVMKRFSVTNRSRRSTNTQEDECEYPTPQREMVGDSPSVDAYNIAREFAAAERIQELRTTNKAQSQHKPRVVHSEADVLRAIQEKMAGKDF